MTPIPIRPSAATYKELCTIVPAEQIEDQFDDPTSTGGAWSVDPANSVELVELIRWANERHAAVFTRRRRRGDDERFGARPRLYLRSRLMSRLLDFDRVSGVITAQAGISMAELHRELAERGVTTGFPTRPWRQEPLGAVLAAALDAHWGPRFGHAESEVLGLSVVFPDGSTATSKVAPKRAVGPDFDRLFLGSRGRYGIIHEATLRVYPLGARTLTSYGAPTLAVALGAIRRAIAQGLDPRAVEILTPAPDRAWGRRRVGLSDALPVLVLVEPWAAALGPAPGTPGTAAYPTPLRATSWKDDTLSALLEPALTRIEPPVGWNIHEGLLPAPRAWTSPVVPVPMNELIALADSLGNDVPPGLWVVRMGRHGGHLSLADAQPGDTDAPAATRVRALVTRHLPHAHPQALGWASYQKRLARKLDPKGILNPDD